MGADCLVRCRQAAGDSGQQRRLEPAAILVSTLQIEVSRPAQFRTLFQNAKVGGTGVKPYIQNILFLFEGMTAAFRAGEAFRQEVIRSMQVPGIGTFFSEHLSNCFNRGLVDNRLAAVFAVKDRNRNAPSSLTGDAPVISVTDHRGNPVTAPFGNPLYIVDCLDSVFLDCVNRTEPLFGCTEHNRLFAAPAVRILVDDVFCCKDSPAFTLR